VHAVEPFDQPVGIDQGQEKDQVPAGCFLYAVYVHFGGTESMFDRNIIVLVHLFSSLLSG